MTSIPIAEVAAGVAAEAVVEDAVVVEDTTGAMVVAGAAGATWRRR